MRRGERHGVVSQPSVNALKARFRRLFVIRDASSDCAILSVVARARQLGLDQEIERHAHAC